MGILDDIESGILGADQAVADAVTGAVDDVAGTSLQSAVDQDFAGAQADVSADGGGGTVTVGPVTVTSSGSAAAAPKASAAAAPATATGGAVVSGPTTILGLGLWWWLGGAAAVGLAIAGALVVPKAGRP